MPADLSVLFYSYKLSLWIYAYSLHKIRIRIAFVQRDFKTLSGERDDLLRFKKSYDLLDSGTLNLLQFLHLLYE